MILMGATGRLIKGNVLDCAEKPFLRTLQAYDPLLYVRWNSRKLRGWGTWEVRRKAEMKAVVDIVSYQGATFVRIEAAEKDIVNHIIDVPYLNYEVLTQLKKMDTWNLNIQRHNVVALAESNMDSHEIELKAKAREDMLYHAKQNRKSFLDLKERIRSGMNPAEIARYWDKA